MEYAVCYEDSLGNRGAFGKSSLWQKCIRKNESEEFCKGRFHPKFL
jgi:hypothetical protein